MKKLDYKKKEPSIPDIIKECEKEIAANPKKPEIIVTIPTSKYKTPSLEMDGNVISFTHAFPLKGEIMTSNQNVTTIKYDARLLLRLIQVGLPQPFLTMQG